MSISHLLEDFETNLHAGSRRRVFSDIQLEEFRLAAFESGYAAGWDDAIANQGGAQAQAVEALTRRIEDLSYTYTEAIAEMLVSIEPVFKALLDQVLPDTTDATLAAALVDHLRDTARHKTGVELVLTVPEGSAAYLSRAVTKQNGLSVKITEEPGLDPGQASIRLPHHEEQVDMSAFTAQLRETIEATFFEIGKEVSNG